MFYITINAVQMFNQSDNRNDFKKQKKTFEQQLSKNLKDHFGDKLEG